MFNSYYERKLNEVIRTLNINDAGIITLLNVTDFTATTIMVDELTVNQSLRIPTTSPDANREIGLDNNILKVYSTEADFYEIADLKKFQYWKEDFLGDLSSFGSNLHMVGDFSFAALAGGTGAGVDNITAPDNTHLGVMSLTTGTTSTGDANIFSSDGNNNHITFGGGEWSLEWLIRIPTLSTSGERFTSRIGFTLGGGADPADGVFFRQVDNVNSGNWVLVARQNSTETTTNAASGPTANTWVHLKIVVNAAGTLATFYANGSSLGTVASNIPNSTGRATNPGVSIQKSVGTTARTLQADFVQMWYKPTATR